MLLLNQEPAAFEETYHEKLSSPDAHLGFETQLPLNDPRLLYSFEPDHCRKVTNLNLAARKLTQSFRGVFC